MTRIGIIVGSTRPGRKGETVAQWVLDNARTHSTAEFEIVDLRSYPLPLFNEEISPMHGARDPGYRTPEYVRSWTEKIAELDGFIFVTPEYNHSTSAVLKNALDYVYGEWNNKAAAFVGYGGVGGARAVEHLRLIASELQLATVRGQVALSTLTDFEDFTELKPSRFAYMMLDQMLDQLIVWSTALAALRAEPASRDAPELGSTVAADTANDSSVLVFVHPRARLGMEEAAKAALAKIAGPARANPDCMEFRVFQDRDDARSFTLLERWVSVDAVIAHGKRDYMAEYMATKDDIFEELPGTFLEEIARTI